MNITHYLVCQIWWETFPKTYTEAYNTYPIPDVIEKIGSPS